MAARQSVLHGGQDNGVVMLLVDDLQLLLEFGTTTGAAGGGINGATRGQALGALGFDARFIAAAAGMGTHGHMRHGQAQ